METDVVTIAAVDPGKRRCGVALVDGVTGLTLSAWLSKSPDKDGEGAETWMAMAQQVSEDVSLRLAVVRAEEGTVTPRRITLLVVERQRIYPPRRGFRGTPNPTVILDLAYVVGGILMAVPAERRREADPSSWKGGSTKGEAAKDLVVRQILDALSPGEREKVMGAELKSTGHNILDAIGIGKWAAARLLQRGFW